MSRLASPEFLAAHHSAVRSPVTLCQIDFTVPTALTLYVATREVVTSDGILWVDGLACDEIDDGVDMYGTGPDPTFATFQLARRTYAALGSDPAASTASILWKGAKVNLWLWDTSLTDYAFRLPQYVDGVIDTFRVLPEGGLELTAMQDRSFNVDFPPKMVDKTNDPYAPDVGSVKLVRPVFYGDGRTILPRSPIPSGLEDELEDMGAARCVFPMVLTDPGTGAASVKLLAADHQVQDILGTRARVFMPTAGDTLAPIVVGGGVTETLGATYPDESYVEIDDNNLIVYYNAAPIDVALSGSTVNTALNPRRAIDVRDETTYATLDQALGYSKLCLLLPNPPKFGEINGSVVVQILFSGDAANANNLRLYVQDSAGNTPVLIGYTSTNPAVTMINFSITSTWYGQVGWEFGLDNGGMTYAGHAAGRTIALVVDFAGGATNKAKVYAAALRFNVAPNRNVIIEGKPRTVVLSPKGEDRIAWWNLGKRLREVAEVKEIANLDGSFYMTLNGPADDGSGTFTGSAAATIERPPDIAHHILTEWADVDPAKLQLSAGAVGSFVDARDKLREDQGSDYKLAAYFGQREKIQTALQDIAAQSMSCIWQDPLTGLWGFDAWRTGEFVQYPDVLGSGYGTSDCDIWGLEVEEQSIVDQRTGVRVGYGFDHFRGKTMFEAKLTPDGSTRGFNHIDARDQQILIDTPNNAFDWETGAWDAGGTVYADTLGSNTYADGIDFAVDLQAAMRSHIVPGYYTYVGHGFTIKAGHNDSLEFGYGASTYATSVPEGNYTADGLAYTVARLMNLIAGLSGVLTVTYSQTTNKFSVASAGSNWNPVPIVTAVNKGSLIWPTMGQVANRAGATSHTFQYARYGETIWACSESTATFQFLFGTGANVATSCSLAAGYEAADTTLGNDTSAAYARGTREQTAATWRDAYQFSGEEVLQADMIRDEATAVRLRNRRFDALLRPPLVVTFQTYRACDLQRMQTFELSGDIDAHRPFPRYGSDGSWAGKVLKCIRVVRGMGPTYMRKIVAVEVRPDRG